jgi:uncharacterized membrane protein
MNFITETIKLFSGGWDVLMLFLIPIGGGIPGGVVLAHSRGIVWPVMMTLYFISDVILAFVFEPVMLLVIRASQSSVFLKRVVETLRMSTQKTTARFGTHLGPLTLILISFGVDPMTGRAATKAAGYGFVFGWLFAIIGDMFYFAVIMISTLWLSDVLGDGTWATFIILALMMLVPTLIRKIRKVKLR